MTHRRARRLLPALLDEALPARQRRAVRAHARRCPSCGRRLREHEEVEALLRLLPPSLVPFEPSARADARLGSLARWFVDPFAAARERLGLRALGVGVAVGAYALAATTSLWAPVPSGIADPHGLVTLVQAQPDEAATLPLGWR
jgi:anti-sigma factor RsiW